LKFSSGTNLSTASGGSVEYDGTVAYFTPNSTATSTTNGGRGLVSSPFFYGLQSTRTLTSGAASTQSLFGVGISLAASTTYEVELFGQINITTTSVSSNAIALILNYSGSVSNLYCSAFGGADNANSISKVLAGNPPTATIFTSTTSASQTINFIIKGLIRTSTAGTFTPQISTSATNSSSFTINPDAFVKLTPIGTQVVTTVGAWA
jgi:hypothetical protein